MMYQNPNQAQLAALEALRQLVCDHGDAFRWSVSKRGRVWLTLTHWDNEKYNTSVELDGMSEPLDMLNALAVLCAAHKGKCFGSVEHSDTWLGTEATKSLVEQAQDVMSSSSEPDPPNVEQPQPHSTNGRPKRDKSEAVNQ